MISRGSTRRSGTLTISGTSSAVDFVDNFVENATSGVTFFVTTGGIVQYKTTSTGDDATFKFSIESIV
jgi:flagellar hook-associated protein FlgK